MGMEVKAGLAKIQAEEDKRARYIAKKKALAEDESLSTVKRGKAFNEMKQAQGEDPLPLRKAKLEQKAAVRRAVKAVNAASKIVSKLAAELGSSGVGEGTLWW